MNMMKMIILDKSAPETTKTIFSLQNLQYIQDGEGNGEGENDEGESDGASKNTMKRYFMVSTFHCW